MKNYIILMTAALLTTQVAGAGLPAGLFEEREAESRTTVADYDSLVFESEGSQIYGQVLKPDASFGEGRPCVMLFHGFAGFARFDDIGQALCRAGCVVVIPHHRGAWGSQGKYSVTHCIEDAVNLVRYARSEAFARQYRSDTNSVFLVGHSMGGNTVLNAAGRVEGVRGVVMLDPCDIGHLATTMDGAAFRSFLKENGADVLRTDGVEALCKDILDHSREYQFPNAAARLRGTGVLWIEAKWGLDEDGARRQAFLKAAEENTSVPVCKWESYPCNHGLMGCRLRATRAIADFVSAACAGSMVDGIYPELAMSNDEGECGTGAVVPWAGSLWVITYGPHCPTGSTDKLYRIMPDLKRTVFVGSVGGTPADRLIHRESNQLLIGPYVIDAQGNVRTVPVAKMPGRLTGAARHLTDPNKVYVATMETGLYELDMSTLAVNTLIRENGKNDREIAAYLKGLNAPWPDGWKSAPKTKVPGYHGKGLCSGFGRVFVANNGEDSAAARANPFVPSGVLADWSRPGADWRTVRRCQFTEIATADGIYGNEHPETNPIWSLGWDAKSVLLAVTTNGTEWTYYRLPKASHCYDGAHGWNTEWPRIREAGLGGGDLLATMHGTFWRFPKTFSPASPNGIRPISTYLKVIGDFCYWKDAPGGGSIVFGCDDHAKNEFLGKRKLKSDQPKIERSTSNLWFVKPEELSKFGPPTGEGWVWYDEDVKAGEVSDPYLWEGYARRSFTFTDAAGRPVAHELIHEGDWVRVRALADAKGARAHFVYAPPATEAPPLDARQPYIDITDDNGRVFRFPNVNGDTSVLCREVATERDLLYVGGVFYELPAENAGGFAALRPIALADEPVRSIAVDRGLIVINGKRQVLDSLWKNGTAPQAYELWSRHFRSGTGSYIVENEAD